MVIIITCRVEDPGSQSLMMKSSGSWKLEGEELTAKGRKKNKRITIKTNQNERNPEVLVNLTRKFRSSGGDGREAVCLCSEVPK